MSIARRVRGWNAGSLLRGLGLLALGFLVTVGAGFSAPAESHPVSAGEGTTLPGSSSTGGLRLSATPRFFAGGVGYGTSGEEAAEDSILAKPAPPPEITKEAVPAENAAGPGRGKMMLLSALVPGLGQLHAGEKTWGSVFLLGEIACWTSLIVFETQGSDREDRFVEHAERFAGVESASGQSDSYYSALATYDRSGLPGGPDSYNEIEVRSEARDLYPDDPNQQAAYIAEHEIQGPLAWDWDTEDHRFEYADLRIASETSYHRANYAIAGLVAGRVLSVLQVVWSTAEPDEEEEQASGAVLAPLVESDWARGSSRFGLQYRF